tara:strand:- start:2805 stop:3623 length:819 start_codon:yes stop_codon:yes gene_type:complete
MNDLSEIKTLKDYIHLFGNNLEHKVCGEKCGNYLFSDNAYLNIWNYNKDAKIIVILRNPVEAVISYHNILKLNGFEHINDVEKAWDLQKIRSETDREIQYFVKKEKLRLQYKHIYKYDIHIKKFINKFGKDQVHTIFFDDILNNKKKLFKELFEFLKVESYNIENFKIINKRQKVNIKNNLKNKVFKFFILFLKKNKIKFFSSKIKSFLGIKKSLGFLVKPIRQKLVKLDVEEKNIDEYKEIKFKERLKKEFKESIINLSKITNRNLDHWII